MLLLLTAATTFKLTSERSGIVAVLVLRAVAFTYNYTHNTLTQKNRDIILLSISSSNIDRF